MDPDLVDQPYHIFKRTYSDYNKYALRTLSELLLALFSHHRFTLRHIVSRLFGKTNVKHKLKTVSKLFRSHRTRSLFLASVYIDLVLFTLYAITQPFANYPAY